MRCERQSRFVNVVMDGLIMVIYLQNAGIRKWESVSASISFLLSNLKGGREMDKATKEKALETLALAFNSGLKELNLEFAGVVHDPDNTAFQFYAVQNIPDERADVLIQVFAAGRVAV